MQLLSTIRFILIFSFFIGFAACSTPSKEKKFAVADFYKTELFKEVQLQSVFADSKTFVDCIPKKPFEEIITDYNQQKGTDGFDLENFVKQNFSLPDQPKTGFQTDTAKSMQAHITSLWPVLTREPDAHQNRSSLIALPNSYIVPGGRFREIYYWDSYFTIEGLVESDEQEMAANMLDNFSFLIDSLGFIPNGNRVYYMGRSQPPFYSLIVDQLTGFDRDEYLNYLPFLLKEYQFWMEGHDELANGQAKNRVVRLEDGAILNRYWDDLDGPRPESYKEDFELVESNDLDENVVYKHLRAGAESGWDYSSRWFEDKKSLKTIETTDIIPVDLNALLYHLEIKIAQGYNWKEQLDSADYFIKQAEKRKSAINKHLWDEGAGMYVDFDFRENTPTGVISLAAAYPLYFKIADKSKGIRVAKRLTDEFLKGGGFVTTLNETGQQWDYPNGWAPLQWITVNGLFNYDFHEEGVEAINRWMDRNRQVYQATGKMMEKYNVVDTTLLAGGGEYPLQDGFGWTNGIALAFQAILDRQKESKEAGLID
ncbi:MAG: alpha,alpha-trehalase TreF [Fulvivirga sp.]|nr:alpha,alpha-trehalase TreF [Fulvivirga sp.]